MKQAVLSGNLNFYFQECKLGNTDGSQLKKANMLI